jgi:tetratricopeptide (TPR) repeat protein
MMHRSRPFVLVIVAAAAACSKRDPAEGNDILSQDRSLVARLESTKDARRPSVPDACGAIRIATSPSAADQQQADALTQQAGVAEMHGDIQDARSLLQRAAALDATNKSAAYHLGRTSEALGDRSTAMTAYCRYLALAPTAAESVEARQRVASLSRAMPHITGSVRDSVVTRSNVAAAASPRRPGRARPSGPGAYTHLTLPTTSRV